MRLLRTVADVRAARQALGPATVGFVPTMGALHDGHLAIFHAARQQCEVVFASIFVNPAQFTDPADLAAYPRDEARDAALAADAGVDGLFAPAASDMYGEQFATWVDPAGAALGLEGDARPGHFRGVATVCLKLFLIVQPHVAYFGQKDAQQVAVIEQLVRDLNVPLEIRVVPTVREPDGLARSSRNVRLSAGARERAAAVPRAIQAGVDAHRHGRDPVTAARAVLSGIDTDYVAVADFHGHPTLAVAVRIDGTRLIDNARLDD